MDDYLIRHYKAKIMDELNAMLENGKLSKVADSTVVSEQILPGDCNFRRFNYWRINRTDLWVDIDLRIELKVQTETGIDTDFVWFSLTLWFSFAGDEDTCEVEELTLLKDRQDRKDCWKLDKYLVPVLRREEIDQGAEDILASLFHDNAPSPLPHSAQSVAKKLGLSIRWLPLNKNKHINGMIFFRNSDIAVRTERKPGERIEQPPHEVEIPANTIVINTDAGNQAKEDLYIFHECIHYEWHYQFYRLQNMHNNDLNQLKFTSKTILRDQKADASNPLEFMEYHAQYGSFGLMLPLCYTQTKVVDLYTKIAGKNRQNGALSHECWRYDYIIRKIAADHHLCKSRVRARLLQLGNEAAKGALNFVDGQYITPFAMTDWKNTKGGFTYVIDRKSVAELYEKNENFRMIMRTGQFSYADSHIVHCEKAGILHTLGSANLSAWANGHIDRVSLRFYREYKDRQYTYTFGMMHNEEAVRAADLFFDPENKLASAEVDRLKNELMEDMPMSFHSALAYIMKGRMTVDELTKRLPINKRTIQRLRVEERKKYDLDTVVTICIGLHLPPWLSEILLDKAGLTVKRYGAYGYYGTILDCFYNDTFQEVQDYLKNSGYPPINLRSDDSLEKEAS